LEELREAVEHSKADETEGSEGLTGGGVEEGEEIAGEGEKPEPHDL